MGSCFSFPLKIESSRLDGKVTSASVPPSPRSPRSQAEILKAANLKSFSFNVLKTATRNFRPDSVLGEGGFGSVFKGWIDEQSLAAAKPGTGTVIAVKRLNHVGIQGHQEWLAEINYLGQLHHPNLVKLIGYCLEDDHRLLVYEFMPRGSLENHLFRRSSYFQPLSWNLRIKVALGAAKGLAYLHSPEAKVIYRDFKSSNILIDSNYNAKLSDFGLAKDGPADGQSHVSTRVMGTHGYAAPEYMATGHLTARSDIYSFGVVLLELLTGRRCIDKNRPSGEQILVVFAKPFLTSKRKILHIMDPRIEGQYSSQPEESWHLLVFLQKCWEQGTLVDMVDKYSEDMQTRAPEVMEMLKVASWCLQCDFTKRPSMSIVVKVLEGVMKVGSSLDYNFTDPRLQKITVEDDKDATTLFPSLLSGPR